MKYIVIFLAVILFIYGGYSMFIDLRLKHQINHHWQKLWNNDDCNSEEKELFRDLYFLSTEMIFVDGLLSVFSIILFILVFII